MINKEVLPLTDIPSAYVKGFLAGETKSPLIAKVLVYENYDSLLASIKEIKVAGENPAETNLSILFKARADLFRFWQGSYLKELESDVLLWTATSKKQFLKGFFDSCNLERLPNDIVRSNQNPNISKEILLKIQYLCKEAGLPVALQSEMIDSSVYRMDPVDKLFKIIQEQYFYFEVNLTDLRRVLDICLPELQPENI